MSISVVRTEKKYSISRIQKNTMAHRLGAVMKADRNGGEDGYTVRPLYFDSIFDDDYFDKINGLESRKKIRLRIYREDQNEVKLEIKQKQGSAQKKESLLISKALAKEMIRGRCGGLMELDSELAVRLYQLLERGLYRPKCIVEYRRIAFAEDCNNIRITLDSGIRASCFFENFFKRSPGFLPVREQPVLEVKYDRFLLSSVKQILDFADVPELAVSKYAMARQLFGL